MTEPASPAMEAWHARPLPCAVCGETVADYLWHARLGVAVCETCPMSDVCGEDITSHCVMTVRGAR